MSKTTVIVPGYARNEIMKSYLQDDRPFFGKEIVSLGSYKSSLVNKETDQEEEITRLYSTIREHISTDNTYYGQLRFPTFFNYFYEFALLLAKQGISKDDLPENNKDEIDKKEILSYLLDQDLSTKLCRKAFDEISDASDIEIYDFFYPDYSDKKDLNDLHGKGAKLIEAKEYKETVFKCFVTNNNVREVIAVAQMLVKEKDNINLNDYVLMLNDEKEYLPIIERIFSYYHIPFEYVSKQNSQEAQRFLSLLKLIRNQDINSFVSAYNHNAFEANDYILTDYLKKYGVSYEELKEKINSAEKVLNDESQSEYIDNTFGRSKVKDLSLIEAECERIMEKIRKIIFSEEFVKLKKEDLKKQCSYAYELLYGKIKENDKLSQEKLNEIRSLHDHIQMIVRQNYEDNRLYEILEFELSRLQCEHRVEYVSENKDEKIIVRDPYQNALGKDKAIILGCTQQNYPRSVANTGFFDEEYIEKIQSYPSLVERNMYFEKEYSRFLHGFKEVIFSYPAASVDGDKYQRSMLINDYEVEKDEKGEVKEEVWNYSECNSFIQQKTFISEDTARKIYLKDNRLKGSPSSMQSYVACPFKYFLERGLGLSDEEPLTIESSVIGKTQHRLLERYFNDEIELNEDNINEQFEPYFAFMKRLLKDQKDEIEAMKDRLSKGFLRTVKFLECFRKADHYEYYPEEKINYGFGHKDYEIYINNGSIDRLDLFDGHYRIIDYKSSEKEIRREDVKKGINFQLLAYLVFYYEQYKKEKGKELKPDLCAYFSMKNSTISSEKVDKKHQLSDEEIRMDDVKYSTYLCEQGRADEDFFKIHKEELDFDDLKQLIPALYKKIADMIMSGNIAIEPTNNSCKFCKFSDICNHDRSETIDKADMKVLVEDKESEDASE